MVAHVRYNIMALDGICKPIGKSFTMFQILFQEFPLLRYTPSILEKNVVLDKVWVKHWEYKSWITLKLLRFKIKELYE